MQSVISALANDAGLELVDVFKTNTGFHQTIVHITQSPADGGGLVCKRSLGVSASHVGIADNFALPLYWESRKKNLQEVNS